MSRKVSTQIQQSIRPSNVVQGLCRMLKRECQKAEVFVEEKFLPFYLYFSPFPENFQVNKEGISQKPEDVFPNMKRFVTAKRKELATHKTVSLNTLKLQFLLRAKLDMDEIFLKNNKEIQRKIKGVLKDILKMYPKTIEERERLLKKITLFVAIENSLGEEGSETETAVKSILSSGDLQDFSMLPKRDKIDVLEDLKVIVCGVRLFNNDAGHEPQKLVDLSVLLEKSFDNTRLSLEYEQELSLKIVTEVTEKIISSDILQSDSELFHLGNLTVDYLKDISLFVHQKYNLISSVLSKLLDLKSEIFETIDEYRSTLMDIHAVLIYKTAVNTKEIYPKFKMLGFIWKKLQLFVYFLSEVNLLLDNVHSLDSVCDHLKDVKIPIQNLPKKDVISFQISPGGSSKSVNKSPDATPSCDYLNYCAWALSLGFVLSVAAVGDDDNRSHVLEVNNHRYLFHSRSAKDSFQCDPSKSTLDIVKSLYENPQLMIFLERTSEIGHLLRIQERRFRDAFYGTKDAMSQTEQIKMLGRVNVEQEIKFLRRKGWQLANQVNFCNNAAQTEAVYRDRFCSGTQTMELRTKCIQTAAEGRGLRGETVEIAANKGVQTQQEE